MLLLLLACNGDDGKDPPSVTGGPTDATTDLSPTPAPTDPGIAPVWTEAPTLTPNDPPHAKVDPGSRRAFLGKVAAAMLAALGVVAPGCEYRGDFTGGERPDVPPEPNPPLKRPDVDRPTYVKMVAPQRHEGTLDP